MDAHDFLAERFEEHRGQLRAVAYRMLGSTSEADDAVQETWLRASRAGTDGVENLGGWLTTIVGRVCLTMLRSRSRRREEPLENRVRVPDPMITPSERSDPEYETVMADSVGLALLVVLEALSPAERLAFVLHDLFAVPFDEIAPIVGRTPTATRQLASRARRRVQGSPEPDTDIAGQRKVVDAFLDAARGGDLEALIAVLDPDVVLRSDSGSLRPGVLVRGADNVAGGAVTYGRLVRSTSPALINGTAGYVSLDAAGQPLSVMAFTIRGGLIAEIHVLADPERLAALDLTVLDG
jgi:RNA polymerase sigma factor (sigma-70 family)